MEHEKRMAGDYEILHAISAGATEIVIGENPAVINEQYMCAMCTTNELFSSYENVMVSDNYVEILQLFGERIAENARSIIKENESKNISLAVLTKKQCLPNDTAKGIVGKIVALKPEILKDEHRTIDSQLFYVTGGFGAQGGSRGNAVFCNNLYTGAHTRIERYEILGEVKPEHLPQWAKDKVKNIHKQNREER